MNLGIIRKIIAFSVFTMIAVVGMSIETNAQWRNDKRYEKQQRKIEKQRRKIAREQRQLQRMRYRYNGRYYDTDNRGAELLRSAVNRGYQQGYRAGQVDASRRTNYRYNDSQYYRNGTYGYQSYVNRSQYQYYFREGFQRGYEDGYYSRSRYGYNSGGGGWNILGSILSSILNFQQY